MKKAFNIALISALYEEVDPVYKFLLDCIKIKELYIPGFEIYLYKFVSGVGFVNSSKMGPILAMTSFDMAINVGSCGALSPDLSIGDIVISTKITQPFLDLSGFGKTDKEVRALNDIDSYNDEVFEKVSNIHYGVTASGDKFVSDIKERLDIHKKTGALTLDMETAVLCVVAKKLQIPFLSIRIVSDDCIENTVEDYKKGCENLTTNTYYDAVKNQIQFALNKMVNSSVVGMLS